VGVEGRQPRPARDAGGKRREVDFVLTLTDLVSLGSVLERQLATIAPSLGVPAISRLTRAFRSPLFTQLSTDPSQS